MLIAKPFSKLKNSSIKFSHFSTKHVHYNGNWFMTMRTQLKKKAFLYKTTHQGTL